VQFSNSYLTIVKLSKQRKEEKKKEKTKEINRERFWTTKMQQNK
jgi:hypothetical protein